MFTSAQFLRNALRAGARQASSSGARRCLSTGVRASAQPASRSLLFGTAAVTVAAGSALAYQQWQTPSSGSKGSFPLIPSVAAASIPPHGIPNTKHERTLIAVKADGVQRALVGEVIARFERKGYKLVGLKLLHATPEQAAEHYADLRKKPFFPSLVQYFSSGPIVMMVWEGHGVIKGGRSLVGATDPADAKPGSLRGDLCTHISRNIVHGSDSKDSAKHEINFWFHPREVVSYEACQSNWIIE